MNVGTIVGSYEVLGSIGTGGQADVYLCRHTSLGTKACLKRVSDWHPSNDLRHTLLRQEARMLARVRHPSLPTLEERYEGGSKDLCLFLTYAEGESLEAVIRTSGILPANTARWILLDVLGALAYLHTNGMIHRDVKPDNIVVDPVRKHATLIDLGLCTDDPTRYLSDGHMYGTPGFIAKELYYGHPASPASDLYALGVTMARMTGAVFDLNPTVVQGERRDPFNRPALKWIRPADPLLRPIIDGLLQDNPYERLTLPEVESLLRTMPA